MFITKEPLCGNLKSKFLLIKDSVETSGRVLFKALLNIFLKENIDLHIIYYELMNVDLMQNLTIGKSNITKTDAVSDPYNWNESGVAKQNPLSLDVLRNKCTGFKGIICIDSLSPLLLINKPDEVYKTLHKILKENSHLQLVALLHADAHESYENEIVTKLASTVLNIVPLDDKLFCTIHYSSGKVTNHLMEYKISELHEFSVLRDFNLPVKTAPSKQPDPTANLTFNLRLKDNEKEARSQLQLPYMQVQNKDITEADDMYDEEDPDDDLDI